MEKSSTSSSGAFIARSTRAHPARRRPGTALPVHLGALAFARDLRRGPRQGEERFARVKIPEGLPRFLDLAGRGRVHTARADHRALPADAFPGCVDRGARGLPGHARRGLRGLRRRRRPARGGREPAPASALRRRRSSRGQRLGDIRDGRAPDERPRSRRDTDLPRREPARPRRAPGADDARPPRAEARAMGPHDPVPARVAQLDSSADLRRGAPGRHPRAPALRLLPGELRGVRAGSCPRPGRDRDEDGGVPDERRQRPRRLAHPVRGGRQAVGLPGGAEGAVRRAAQHRVVGRWSRPASTSSTAFRTSRSTRR